MDIFLVFKQKKHVNLEPGEVDVYSLPDQLRVRQGADPCLQDLPGPHAVSGRLWTSSLLF